jgi:hypothetical protein
MCAVAKDRGRGRPGRVSGSTCDVGPPDSFRFCQIPDEILAALQIEDGPAVDADAVERLEAAAFISAT